MTAVHCTTSAQMNPLSAITESAEMIKVDLGVGVIGDGQVAVVWT